MSQYIVEAYPSKLRAQARSQNVSGSRVEGPFSRVLISAPDTDNQVVDRQSAEWWLVIFERP